MNKSTYEKLKKNPHYRPNNKQLVEFGEQEKPPMIEFGIPKRHNSHIDRHPTNLERKSRQKVI